MGFADDFYYGQCKVVAVTTASADNGKTVTITSSGGRTWSGTMASKKCEFMLPPRDKYTIALISGGVTQFSTDFFCGYGEYLEIEVGMNKNTALGIKNIVNAGLEADYFQVGDQITFKENGADATYDVVEVAYRQGVYGHNVVFQRHACLNTTRQMNTSNTNAGGYNSSLMKTYLDGEFFNSLESDLQDVITEYSYQGSVGSQSTNLQTEEHKVFLPVEYNIFGATSYAAGTERTTGGAEQWSYYATSANRVKAANGASCAWWLSSPSDSASTAFCGVAASGAASNYAASGSIGVAPCFMIAAD